MTLKLYEIVDAYSQIRVLAEEGGEEDSWAQALADLQDEAQPKVLALARLIREQQLAQEALTSELLRLHIRKSLASRAEDRLKAYVQSVMEAMQAKKVEDMLITITLQQNGQPSTVITDATLVPPKYVLGTLRLPLDEWPAELKERVLAQGALDYDKVWLRAAHNEGQEVPGVTFITGKHIRIR